MQRIVSRIACSDVDGESERDALLAFDSTEFDSLETFKTQFVGEALLKRQLCYSRNPVAPVSLQF